MEQGSKTGQRGSGWARTAGWRRVPPGDRGAAFHRVRGHVRHGLAGTVRRRLREVRLHQHRPQGAYGEREPALVLQGLQAHVHGQHRPRARYVQAAGGDVDDLRGGVHRPAAAARLHGDKCGVGLRTAWFMRRRIIECIQRYNPSLFHAVAGDRVEIDETYFRDSYKGYRKGTMPRPQARSEQAADMRRHRHRRHGRVLLRGVRTWHARQGTRLQGAQRAHRQGRPRRHRQGRGLPRSP